MVSALGLDLQRRHFQADEGAAPYEGFTYKTAGASPRPTIIVLPGFNSAHCDWDVHRRGEKCVFPERCGISEQSQRNRVRRTTMVYTRNRIGGQAGRSLGRL